MIHGSQKRPTPAYFRTRIKSAKSEATIEGIFKEAEFTLYVDDYNKLQDWYKKIKLNNCK